MANSRFHIRALGTISNRRPLPTLGGRYLMAIIAAGSAGVFVDELDARYFPEGVARPNQSAKWHMNYDVAFHNVVVTEHHADGTTSNWATSWATDEYHPDKVESQVTLPAYEWLCRAIDKVALIDSP